MDLIRARATANGDDSYGNFVSAVPFSYYQRRVKGLGLAGLGRVLDVGCGYGHWTAALAEVNDEAVGIDQSEPRLGIAREFVRSMGLENVTLDLGDAARLPYPDQSFDGLVCYGVFQFLNRDDALAEFHRVLAPGGRLYVLTAARGWWLAMWVKSLRGDPNLRRSAFHGWALSGQGSPPHAVSRRRAVRLLRRGWTNVEAGFDGELDAGWLDPTPPVYASRWLGIDNVVEFVAERSRPDPGDQRSKTIPALLTSSLRPVERTSRTATSTKRRWRNILSLDLRLISSATATPQSCVRPSVALETSTGSRSCGRYTTS